MFNVNYYIYKVGIHYGSKGGGGAGSAVHPFVVPLTHTHTHTYTTPYTHACGLYYVW